VAERTEHAPGTFSWVDVTTTDLDGAAAFYKGLLGWDHVDSPIGDGAVYRLFQLHGKIVAGGVEQQAEQRSHGIPPHWNNYVTVEDLEARAARAADLGGTVVVPSFDVMTAGRMAVIQDPTGAYLSMWEPRESIGATRVNEPGCLTWNDLVSTDPAAAREFYGGLFGWRYEAMGEGSADEYWVCFNGDRSNGGLMKTPQEGMPSFWYPYFAVEDADAAKRRIEELGGQPMVGPQDVPQGRFVVAADPQGAAFAVFAGDFDD
jgi:uncharacterized protein